MLGRGRPNSGDSGSERENCWRDCVRDIRAGNADALGRLYDASAPALFGIAFRITKNSADAEEVCWKCMNRCGGRPIRLTRRAEALADGLCY